MEQAGREAARTLLDGPGGDWLTGRTGGAVVLEDGATITLPGPRDVELSPRA
jgi:hypothetical protein